MTVSRSRGGRRLSVAVVSVDLLCFAAFGLVGLNSHAEPLTAANFARAFVPFAAAWLLVAFTLGFLAKPGPGGPPSAFQRVAAAWSLAWLMGFVARMLIFGRPFVLAFALVSFVGLGILLVAWRAALVLVLARKRARGAPPALVVTRPG